MRKFKILAGLTLIIISLLIACDDFFSPTIEIFNEITTPTNVEQQNNTVQQN
jgi:hypothetical protein